MLEMTLIVSPEMWDSIKNEFIPEKTINVALEHSLLSIARWESKHHKVFLNSTKKRSLEETLDYVRCMMLTRNVPPSVYKNLRQEDIDIIQEYMNDSNTATTFGGSSTARKGKERVLTNEVIYADMIMLQIPHEFEKWHINRLLTLIRILQNRNPNTKKVNKRSQAELNKENARLNAINRAKFNTKG